jgi:hypothetical protein
MGVLATAWYCRRHPSNRAASQSREPRLEDDNVSGTNSWIPHVLHTALDSQVSVPFKANFWRAAWSLLGMGPRYLDWGAWDPVAVMAGISEAAIFVVSFITILLSNHKRSRAKFQSSEEGIRKIPADSSITTAAGTKTSSPPK